jgi:hypothetical protein
LTKLTKEDNKELKLLAYGRPYVVVQDYNGNAFMMGLNYGAEVTGGTIVTGAAMGDLSGYTLTMEVTGATSCLTSSQVLRLPILLQDLQMLLIRL